MSNRHSETLNYWVTLDLEKFILRDFQITKIKLLVKCKMYNVKCKIHKLLKAFRGEGGGGWSSCYGRS